MLEESFRVICNVEFTNFKKVTEMRDLVVASGRPVAKMMMASDVGQQRH